MPLPPIFLLFPLKTVALPSQTIFIQHFITIIKHMHEKKINSKRQRSQKPGFARLIFIFLSCLLFFYVALFFSLREMERDMPFLSACASLWCFSGLLFCMGASPEPRTSIAEQPVDYPDPRQHFDRTTNHSSGRPCQV